MGIERQPADSLAEKRYAPRKPLSLTLHAWVEGAERRLIVRDLSHTGFMAESGTSLAAGDAVVLEFPSGMRRAARVVWAGGETAGCTFEAPISKAEFSAALLKSDFVSATAAYPGAPVERYLIEEHDEPPVQKLPMWGSMGVIGTASIALWSVLIAIGFAIF